MIAPFSSTVDEMRERREDAVTSLRIDLKFSEAEAWQKTEREAADAFASFNRRAERIEAERERQSRRR